MGNYSLKLFGFILLMILIFETKDSKVWNINPVEETKNFLSYKVFKKRIDTVFGVKTETECNHKNFSIIDIKNIPEERQYLWGSPFLMWGDGSRSLIKPPKRNTNFDKYYIHCSIESNVVYGISAAQVNIKENTPIDCQIKGEKIYNFFRKKYFLPKGIIKEEFIGKFHSWKIMTDDISGWDMKLHETSFQVGCAHNALNLIYLVGIGAYEVENKHSYKLIVPKKKKKKIDETGF